MGDHSADLLLNCLVGIALLGEARKELGGSGPSCRIAPPCIGTLLLMPLHPRLSPLSLTSPIMAGVMDARLQAGLTIKSSLRPLQGQKEGEQWADGLGWGREGAFFLLLHCMCA